MFDVNTDLNAILARSESLFRDKTQRVLTPVWLRQVASLCAEAKQIQANRWLVYEQDVVTFSIYLFGLLAAGKEVVLAPSNKAAKLEKLSEYADVALGDLELNTLPVWQWKHTPGTLSELVIPGQAQLTFFTSGSSGEAKPVLKRWWQLMTEVEQLNAALINNTNNQPIPLKSLISITKQSGYKVINANKGGEALRLELDRHDKKLISLIKKEIDRFDQLSIGFSGQGFKDEVLIKE